MVTKNGIPILHNSNKIKIDQNIFFILIIKLININIQNDYKTTSIFKCYSKIYSKIS